MKNRMKLPKPLPAILLGLLLSAPPLLAQTVPQLINYQGQLSSADGTPLPTPVATTDYKLSFAIYNQPKDGEPIWGPQTFEKVPVVQGYFNVMLGPTDSKDQPIAKAFNSASAYVEITVNDKGLSSRQQILSAPFALKSEQAANTAKLNGFDWSALFGVNDPSGKIDGAKIANIPSSSIAAASIDITHLAKAVAEALVPPGTIVAFGGDATKVPDGWLLCDGQELLTDDPRYVRLYMAIGHAWGQPSAREFRLPDLRGLFLRGLDDSPRIGASGRDRGIADRVKPNPGGNSTNQVGSYQYAQLAKHEHALPVVFKPTAGNTYAVGTGGDPGGRVYTAPEGGSETRPENVAVNYIIKF